MERYNLKANCGKYGSDYKAIDWHTIDIRQCSFSQPPGKTSVLGDFKFKFPNKHSVYMHDTHDRSLFKQKQRTFSHGCIRVQRPRRLVEILLKHDKGMSAERIGEIIDGPKQLHKETLNQPIPVHITYFTLLFDDQGKFSSSPDYYGHDKRLAAVLAGKSYNLAKADARKRRAPGKKRTSKKPTSWWDGFFPAN
jgi:murein L,D-transpeptidase YcbB/YkuD